jgi:hypothetical protein
MCSQGSFVIEISRKDQIEKPAGMVQSLCLLSTTFMLQNLNPMSGPAKEYADHNVHFYQLFGLTETLGLYHTLCATRRIASGKSNAGRTKYQTILAPSIKDGRIGKIKSLIRVVEDQFIVPDGLEEDSDTLESFNVTRSALPKSAPFTAPQNKVQDDTFFSIDARRLFKASFLKRELEEPEASASPERSQNMVDYARIVQSGIELRKNNRLQGLMTL